MQDILADFVSNSSHESNDPFRNCELDAEVLVPLNHHFQ